MSNKRWTSDEKIELMKLFSDGKSYEQIATTLNRTANAIKLRLESIVYDNLIKGKHLSVLTRTLNTDPDTIKQLYYSHKSFKQSRGETVEDIDFMKEEVKSNNKQIKKQVNPMSNTHIPENQKIISNDYHPDQFLGNNENLHHNKISKIEKTEIENHILEEIIKNYRLKKQLRQLYVDGKLDKNNQLIYERLVKKMD